jgi:maleate isomerase
MIVPSSNTCLEPVTYRILEGVDEVSVHSARVPVTRIALDADSTSRFSVRTMTEAAQLLADAKVDVIAWNGTAGSWLGPAFDRELCAAITASTGVPATTSTLALLDACRAFGVTRLGLALPYTSDVAEQIASTYRGEGIECTAVEFLGLTENTDFAAVPPAGVAELITASAQGQPHAVAVVCTNVYGAAEVAPLEAKLGLPIFDSVSATLWKTLESSGVWLPGWGALLESGTMRAGLQRVTEALLEATGADRTTLRIDVPGRGLQVDLAAAEALRPGVPAIRHDASLDQRNLNTVRWLELHRSTLVQPHFRADPNPPEALISVYGVNAQMLGPVVRTGELVGWLSAHSLTERPWTDADQRAMAEAVAQVHAALDGARHIR